MILDVGLQLIYRVFCIKIKDMKLQDLKKSLNSITSRELATLTGKEHYDILKAITAMEGDWLKLGQGNFTVTSYTDKSNRQSKMYTLTKTESLYIVSKFNNELRGRIILRWEQLELQLQSEQLRLAERNEARLGCPKMTNAVQSLRIEQGKETKSFHYSNEHNMIYRIVLGATAKKYKEALDIEGSLRDGLTPLQIEAVRKIQDMNTTLIDLGIEFKSRKESLNTFFNKRFNKRLKDEHDLING